MTIDLNNQDEVEKLKNAANSRQGILIVEYLQDALSELDFEQINAEAADQQVGQDFKAIFRARTFLKNKINFLIN